MAEEKGKPKISKRTIAIIAICLAVGVVIGISLMWWRDGSSATHITATTTTTTQVWSATSLTCNVDEGYENLAMATIVLDMKNIGTNQLEVRAETTVLGQSFTYIVNGEQQKAWMLENGAWADVSDNFAQYWGSWSQWSQLSNPSQTLQAWSGGEYTYTDPNSGMTFRVYDITVNPALSDSLFVP